MIKNESVRAIIAEDYDRAALLEQAADRLRSRPAATDRRSVVVTALANRECDAERELETEQEQWEVAIVHFQSEQARLRAELQARHAAEREELGRRWAASGSLLPYSKASPDLLKLRKMQKALALAKRFDEAKQVKRQAEAVQAGEARAAEKRAIAAVRAAERALAERQQREIACFEEHERRNLVYLEREREKLTEPIVMHIRAIRNEKSEIAAIATRARRETRLQRQRTAVVNPRARTRAHDFRACDGPEKLNLDLQTVRKFAVRKRER
jgi:hypothetical protein